MSLHLLRTVTTVTCSQFHHWFVWFFAKKKVRSVRQRWNFWHLPGGGGHLRKFAQKCVAEGTKPQPSLSQNSFISLPYLTQETSFAHSISRAELSISFNSDITKLKVSTTSMQTAHRQPTIYWNLPTGIQCFFLRKFEFCSTWA